MSNIPNPMTIAIPARIMNTSPQSSPVSNALPTPATISIKPDKDNIVINPSEVSMLKIHSQKDEITFPKISY